LKLLLASRNPNKLRELRSALSGWEVELLEAPDEAVEDGETFLDNARIKARHGRAHAPGDAWVAGEDSGIEVVALGGRPGVESARWASDGVARLLVELARVEDRRRMRDPSRPGAASSSPGDGDLMASTISPRTEGW